MKTPSQDDVRGFGLVMLAATLLLAWKLRLHGSVVVGAWVGVGLGLATASFFAPSIVRPLAKVWGKLGQLLGRVTTPILLVLVFAFVVIPLRGVLTLLRIDPLRLRLDRHATSYFIERPKKIPDKTDFERLS